MILPWDGVMRHLDKLLAQSDERRRLAEEPEGAQEAEKPNPSPKGQGEDEKP